MSETINTDYINPPTVEESRLDESAPRVGAFIVDQMVDDGLFDLKLGGKDFKTDVPEDIKLFNPENMNIELFPKVLDELEVGEYHVMGEIDDPDFIYLNDWDAAPKVEGTVRTITISEKGGDKNVSVDSFGTLQTAQWSLHEQSASVMVKLGYEIDESGLSLKSVPTPETAKKNAASLGVSVNLIDSAHIDSPTYVAEYAAGRYPLAVGNEIYYQHDVRDDHLTAVIYGGDLLRDALAEYADGVISSGDSERIDIAAGKIDSVTNYLRHCVYDGEANGEAFSPTNAMRTFRDVTQSIGVSWEQSDNILKTAILNASGLGVRVKKLD